MLAKIKKYCVIKDEPNKPLFPENIGSNGVIETNTRYNNMIKKNIKDIDTIEKDTKEKDIKVNKTIEENTKNNNSITKKRIYLGGILLCMYCLILTIIILALINITSKNQ
jgi:hypothetical protein